jgi:hypothetical protein
MYGAVLVSLFFKPFLVRLLYMHGAPRNINARHNLPFCEDRAMVNTVGLYVSLYGMYVESWYLFL